MKAAVDEGLVTKVDNTVETFTPEDNKFALYHDVTEYLAALDVRDRRNQPELARLPVHAPPRCAVVQFCGAAPKTPIIFSTVPGTRSPRPTGTEEAKDNGFVVLEYNLGDVRVSADGRVRELGHPVRARPADAPLVREGPQGNRRGEPRPPRAPRPPRRITSRTGQRLRIEKPMPIVLAQQLVDAGGGNGQGGLAFVLLVVLVAGICGHAVLHGPHPQAVRGAQREFRRGSAERGRDVGRPTRPSAPSASVSARLGNITSTRSARSTHHGRACRGRTRVHRGVGGAASS